MSEPRVAIAPVFDLEIKGVVDRLIAYGVKEYPDRPWYLEVVFWDDRDYRARLVTSFDRRRRKVYAYHKSQRVFTHYSSEIIEDGVDEVRSREVVLEAEK